MSDNYGNLGLRRIKLWEVAALIFTVMVFGLFTYAMVLYYLDPQPRSDDPGDVPFKHYGEPQEMTPNLV